MTFYVVQGADRLAKSRRFPSEGDALTFWPLSAGDSVAAYNDEGAKSVTLHRWDGTSWVGSTEGRINAAALGVDVPATVLTTPPVDKARDRFRSALAALPKSVPPGHVNETKFVDIKLGEEQQRAYDCVLTGANVLITGPGGTGKSLLMFKIIDDLRAKGMRVAVCASTGVAALNIRGQTIHSWLGTGLASNIKALRARMTPDTVSRAAERLCIADVLIVDEMSMLHGDYVTMVDWWCKLVRGDKRPFGGLQVIFVADFLQLPSVIRKEDKVDVKYAFLSPAWTDAKLVPHYLRQGYRQPDPEFRKHLLRLRRGICPQDTLDYFNTRVRATLAEKRPTEVFPTNNEVDRVNQEHLDALPGELFSRAAKYTGNEKWVERLQGDPPCMDPLELRVGAEVMFTRNDLEMDVVNGTRGVVVKCDAEGVQVREHGAGLLIRVSAVKWEAVNADQRVMAEVEQLPLKLAAAISTHKSQGSTLNSIVFNPTRVFERHMTYVALSRVRTIDGLRLTHPLRAEHVRASQIVVDFYKSLLQQMKENANGP